jgi:hypothetical protein
MGDEADDLTNVGFDNTTDEDYDENWSFGRRQYRAPKCTNSDIHNIVENLVRSRKAQKTISRDVLDKHVAEIAKMRFNPNVTFGEVERTIDDLLVKAARAKNKEVVGIYRRIALCAILLADAAENGEW